ncbi:MAG: family 16 glycosylhydrolase [Salinivirgaceae bacterium]|jgi:beta-glucanase (GH16 family)|nr:family 16 glycosylhydrolase [Salinivirgaceae bacterium]
MKQAFKKHSEIDLCSSKLFRAIVLNKLLNVASIKKYMLFLFCTLSTLILSAQWVQVWGDEFNYNGNIDASKWYFESGANWPNGELQYYTDNRSDNCRVNGTHLIIEAKQESYGGKNYTSARINSRESWTYGKFEMSARLTKGNALWPAFWLLPDDILTGAPWPYCGEIDIMEYWSWAPYTIRGTIHTDAYNHIDHTEKQGVIDLSNHPGDDFHTYSAIWGPDRIDWFVDEVWFFGFDNENTTETWPFNKPFHVLLNLAVEGWLLEDSNNINTWTKQTMEVDYVKVYQWGVQSSTPIGQTVHIKGSNGKYLSSENGTSGIICNRTAPGGWETFEIVNAGNNLIALKGNNNKYVSSENGLSDMYCNRSSFGDWEKFEWIDHGNGDFSLKATNNQYVTSNNGASALICDRTTIQGWEKFTYESASSKSADISNIIKKENISLYPNPASDYVIIDGLKDMNFINLYDRAGKLILQKSIRNTKQTIDLKNINSGIYFFKISGFNGNNVYKLIIQ